MMDLLSVPKPVWNPLKIPGAVSYLSTDAVINGCAALSATTNPSSNFTNQYTFPTLTDFTAYVVAKTPVNDVECGFLNITAFSYGNTIPKPYPFNGASPSLSIWYDPTVKQFAVTLAPTYITTSAVTFYSQLSGGVSLDTWYMVMVRRIGSRVRIYVNGVLSGSYTYGEPLQPYSPTNNGVWVGYRMTINFSTIEEICWYSCGLWTRGLSDAEIASIYPAYGLWMMYENMPVSLREGAFFFFVKARNDSVNPSKAMRAIDPTLGDKAVDPLPVVYVTRQVSEASNYEYMSGVLDLVSLKEGITVPLWDNASYPHNEIYRPVLPTKATEERGKLVPARTTITPVSYDSWLEYNRYAVFNGLSAFTISFVYKTGFESDVTKSIFTVDKAVKIVDKRTSNSVNIGAYAWSSGANDWVGTDSLNTPYTWNSKKLITITWDGSELTLFLNGVEQNSVAAAVTLGTSAAGGFFGVTSFDGFVTSSFGDFIVYNRALSENERLRVERHIGARYGITV